MSDNDAEVQELAALLANGGGDAFDEVEMMREDKEAGKKRRGEGEAKFRGKLTQWNSGDGKSFVPTAKTIKALPPGYYEISFDPSVGTFFVAQPTKTDELLHFPHTNTEKVLEQIRTFWEMEERFKLYGLPYRRGILLWGPPGGGKTSAVRLVVEDVVKRGGVAFKFLHPKMFSEGLRIFREIQPNDPIVVVMEDLDAILRMYNESSILNILDGVDQVHKVVFLATTNYPEVLGPRIVNRPSRFDRRYRVPEPSAEARLMYFDHLLKGQAKELGIDTEKWVKDTEGMSLAHLKELFVGVTILGDNYDDLLSTLKQMKEKIRAESEGESVMGFKR